MAEMTTSPHHNNNHITDASMRTFKPPNYDEGEAFPALSSILITVLVAGLSSSSRSRPLAMRRERSDLGANGFNFGIVKSNAQRLAFHNESSPGPAHASFSKSFFPQN